MLDRLIALDQQFTLSLNGSDNLFLDGIASVATSTVTWLPVGLVLLYVLFRNNSLRNVGFVVLALGLCILLADQVASGICKPLFERYRPAQDPSLMYMVDIVDGYRGGRYGFFSSHAANTFSVAVFLSFLIRNRAAGFALFSWALLNCWTRVYLGVHYLGDLLVGCLWGSLVAVIIYFLYKKIAKVEINTSHCVDTQTVSGYLINDVYLLVSVLLMTYIYVIISGL